jgi:hypothetical protein
MWVDLMVLHFFSLSHTILLITVDVFVVAVIIISDLFLNLFTSHISHRLFTTRLTSSLHLISIIIADADMVAVVSAAILIL